MATISFLNILPNPDYKIGDAGELNNSGGGQGYKSVKVTSEQPLIKSRTNSGKLYARAQGAHTWKVSISYNPMTRDEFQPLHSFLMERRGQMKPFYISLPQYKAPRNSSFATYVADSNENNMSLQAAASAGVTNILIGASGYVISSDGTPKPGDMFTVDLATHTKIYQVTKVETPSLYETNTTPPGSNQVRMHFMPPLQKAVANGTELVFDDPKMRVVQRNNTQEYSLNTDNLCSSSLSLEEAQL